MLHSIFTSLTALTTVSVLAFASPAQAWDAEGHRIIAHLAFERLTPKAKAQITELITHTSEQGTPSCTVTNIEDASTWPDCVPPLHGRWDYLAKMHYEDFPICAH